MIKRKAMKKKERVRDIESRQKVCTGQSVPFSKYKSTFLKEKGPFLEKKGTFLEQKSIKKGPLLSKRSIFWTFSSLKKVL